jgi:hypothetical protein
MKGGFYLTDEFIQKLKAFNIHSKNNPLYIELIKKYLFSNSLSYTLISNKSLYGYVFSQKFNSLVKAPAQEVDLNNIGCVARLNKECYKDIVNYVYKICFIGPSETYFNVPKGNEMGHLGFVTEAELLNEATIQYNLYNNKFLNGNNIVPPILSPKPMIITNIDDILFKSSMTNSDFKNAYLAARQNGATSMGAICMGFAEGYDTLNNLIANYAANLRVYITLARLAYLMVLYQGYIHGDAHGSNVLINPIYKDWVSPDYPGRALVIDFGSARRLNPEEQAEFNVAFEKRSAKKLLSIIVNGNKCDENSRWLISPQFAGDDINPPFFNLIENYKRHEVLINTVYPAYSLESSLEDVMTMIKPPANVMMKADTNGMNKPTNVEMNGGKKTKRRLNKKRKTRR